MRVCFPCLERRHIRVEASHNVSGLDMCEWCFNGSDGPPMKRDEIDEEPARLRSRDFQDELMRISWRVQAGRPRKQGDETKLMVHSDGKIRSRRWMEAVAPDRPVAKLKGARRQ